MDALPVSLDSLIVLISDDTQAIIGERSILVCMTSQQEEKRVISWELDGQTLTNSSRVVITEEEVVHEERNFTQSFLQICNVNITDVGIYTCIVSDTNQLSVNYSTQLTSHSKCFTGFYLEILVWGRSYEICA